MLPDVFVWLAAVAVLGLLFYGMGFYLIAEAEGFFAEIVFELLLAAGLVRGLRKVDSAGWVGGFISVTWPALFIVTVLSLGIGAYAEHRYPGVKTMPELLQKMRAGTGQGVKPGASERNG